MAGNYDFTYAGQSVKHAVMQAGCRFTVLVVHGAALLGRNVRTVNRDGVDGSRRIGSELPERIISVGFKIETGLGVSMDSMVSLESAEKALMMVLGRPGLVELRLPHQDGYFLAEAGAISVSDRYEHLLKGTIEFVCPSPFLFGDHRSVGRGSGNRVQISSNYYVEPLILWRTRIGYGAPHIEVDGQRLTIDTQVGEGQQIRIDSARKETRIGGVLEVEHIHGTFPRLYDGSVVSITPGGTDIEFQYQERWI